MWWLSASAPGEQSLGFILQTTSISNDQTHKVGTNKAYTCSGF